MVQEIPVSRTKDEGLHRTWCVRFVALKLWGKKQTKNPQKNPKQLAEEISLKTKM